MSRGVFRILPKAPPKKMEDCYGNEILPGQRVAYNFSGEVRMGIVTKVNQKSIKIARIDPASRKGFYSYSRNNKISKVTSPRNLVVLHSTALAANLEGEDGSDDDE